VEDEIERSWKDWLRTIPRVVIAIFWALVTFVALFIPVNLFGNFLPIGYAELFVIVVIFAVFSFAIHLLSETIYCHALSVARTLLYMALLLTVTKGGIFPIELPLEGVIIQIVIDFKPVLAAMLSVSLLSIAKNALQVWDLLSERDEEPEKIT